MNTPQKRGRYLLLSRIARGGMADVYRGKLLGVEGFEKEVAIKEILPHWSDNREFITMLVDEAKVLVRLTHANIVQVIELGKEAETYFIAMEYVDGVDLRSLLHRLSEYGEKIPLSIVSQVVQQIAGGLHYAHERFNRAGQPLGIVHRDISPQNILLSFEGEVKITDFGIAKALGKTNETVAGTLKGKFAYMSPEQALGKDIDRRTDIFALGILLFEMATGERLFKGRNDFETLEAVRRAEVAFLPRHEPLPPAFKEIILKCLKANPEDRFATALEVLSQLKKAEGELGESAQSHDVRNLVRRLFADKLEEKKKWDEEFSAASVTAGELSPEATPGRTKVLVTAQDGSPTVSPSSTQSPTLIHAREDEIPTQLEARQSASALSATKPREARSPFMWISGALGLALLVSGWLTYRGMEEKRASVVPAAPLPLFTSRFSARPWKEATLAFAQVPPSVPVVVEPVPEMPKPVEVVPPKPVVYGRISVVASPWGKVSIAGVGGETPFRSSKVPAGNQTLTVRYPPLSQNLSRQLYIREGALIECRAQFGDKNSLVCN